MENNKQDKPKRTRPVGAGKPKGCTVKQLTKEDYDKWIPIVIDLSLNKGYAKLAIKSYLMQENGFSNHQSNSLLEKSYVTITEVYKSKSNRTIENCIARFETLYSLSLKNGDVKNATKTLVEITKLANHYIDRLSVEDKVNNIPEVITITEVIEEDNESEPENDESI